ncbi:mucin-1-like [Palaemon carinicauda]|uniref:mucin-1-like n=1 Tax=Palaemon carinicauda TaxID=392227 RepID=UPI0035B66F26
MLLVTSVRVGLKKTKSYMSSIWTLAKRLSIHESSKTTKCGLPEDAVRSSPSQKISLVVGEGSVPALGTLVAEASVHHEVILFPKQGRSQVQFAITLDGCMSNLDEETPSLLRSPHHQRGNTPTPSQAPLSSDPGRSRFRSLHCQRGSSPAPSQDHEPSDQGKSSPRSSCSKSSSMSSSRSRRHTSQQSTSSMSPRGKSTSRPSHKELSHHSSSSTPGLSSLRSSKDSSVSSV